ncbi:hypothetical protein LWI29_008434 [Acer saccharum]|uniref:Retrovirus-related Pol polyprotein from transposon TNT 1-94 n=1 Tax=Acer saccharum TaxID=4024 RepID=A0AA39SS48_ACESA|nr:hypothetical protein LWI29_008434 [Acer saccharum]
MTDSKNSGEDFLTKKNESTTLSGLATKSGMSNSAIEFSYFTGNSDWIIDSGATDHMTCDRYRFSHLSSKSSKITITNANGVSSPVIGIALSSAVYLINRTPSSFLNFRRPLDALSDHCTLPSVVLLAPWIFGCVVYVPLHPHQRTKLDSCALRCVFVGYGINQKGYKCYDPSSKRFYVSMDVIFHEKELFYRPPTDLSLQGENQEEVINLEELQVFFPRDSDFSSIRATGSDTTNGPDEDNRTIENDTIDQSDDRERLQIGEVANPDWPPKTRAL